MVLALAKSFQDPRRVVGQIAAHLKTKFPQAEAELYVRAQSECKSRCIAGPLEGILNSFVQFCGEFPNAFIRFEPEHRYGMVAVVTCDCAKPEKTCGSGCPGVDARPRALIRLLRIGTNDFLLGDKCLTPTVAPEPHRKSA